MERRSRGFVLVSALLLLMVVTIMSLSIFRSFGLQERIGGNVREKQRALQAAADAQQYAEWWVAEQSPAPRAVALGLAVMVDSTCNATPINANTGTPQICSNTLASLGGVLSNPPWGAAGSPGPGADYTPRGMVTGAVTPGTTGDVYPVKPHFYITDTGAAPNGRGEMYQVDAYSFGTSQATVAVVESTLSVSCVVCGMAGP
jgi:type IV pilus assembly protein PilX